MNGGATPSAPAVERILSILELLSVTKSGLTLPELSRRLGLPKSSTYCLLVTQERRGYLLRNNRTHRYMFGLKLFSLANMALSGVELRENAASFLHPLMEWSRLTVHMAIIEDHEAVLIEKVEPPGLVRLAGGAGRRDSEKVAPGNPVMPITDCFGGGFVRINGGQLGKRSSHV